jgi:hypothetical protein
LASGLIIMAQLDRLMREARKAMRFRGHNPVTDWKEKGRAKLHCCNEGCDMGVWIIVKPLPNEIDIGGEAVALNCNVATPKLKLSGVKLTIPMDKSNDISMEAVIGC